MLPQPDPSADAGRTDFIGSDCVRVQYFLLTKTHVSSSVFNCSKAPKAGKGSGSFSQPEAAQWFDLPTLKENI
jgi:hypothetical protein